MEFSERPWSANHRRVRAEKGREITATLGRSRLANYGDEEFGRGYIKQAAKGHGNVGTIDVPVVDWIEKRYRGAGGGFTEGSTKVEGVTSGIRKPR